MGLEQSDEDYERLLEALITLKPISDKAKLESHQNALERLTRERDQLLSESFHFHVPLREAMFGQKPDESVAVAPIAPYPRGFPLSGPVKNHKKASKLLGGTFGRGGCHKGRRARVCAASARPLC